MKSTAQQKKDTKGYLDYKSDTKTLRQKILLHIEGNPTYIHSSLLKRRLEIFAREIILRKYVILQMNDANIGYREKEREINIYKFRRRLIVLIIISFL